MKYFVTIEGREIPVEVDGERVRVSGRELRAHLVPLPGTPLRHLLLEDVSSALLVESAERGMWHLALGGIRHVVRVVDERTRHIESLTGPAGARAGPAVLKAPMPGLVVRVLVEVGQAVEAGSGLVVLEAMKMENELMATAGGVIRRVAVTAGAAVEKGQVLVEFSGLNDAGPP
jgi:pyruvate carboxylase subunit B